MANNLGDFAPSTVVYGKFTSVRVDTGAPATLAGTPALSVYKNNSTTQSTSGVTLTADFDSVTGLNHFAIDTSSDGTFYAAGGMFDVVITTGTVNSVSAVGQCVGQFTLNAISSLRPTTAARTLDVSAGGEAGIDWANIGSPTTAVNLSATNIDTDQVVATVTNMVTANVTQISGDATAADNLETAFDGGSYNVGGGGIVAASVTGAVGSVTGAVGSVTGNVGGNVNGNVVGTVASVVGNVGGNVTGTVASVVGNVGGNVVGSVASVSGNVGGNVTGSVGSVVADVSVGNMTAGALGDFFTVDSGETYGDAVPGSVVYEIAENAGGGTAPTVQQIVDGVWDEPIASHLTSGSTGAALNAAGSAGDPWSTTLPGAYGAGTAGYIIGNNVDAAISSRATDAGVWANGTRTLTAWSFQLPSNGLANVTAWTVALTGNITGNLSGSVGSVTGLNPAYVDVAISSRLAAADYVAPDNADVAAIKAKTDELTFTLPGIVDSNIGAVNGINVTGTGTGGDPWGP